MRTLSAADITVAHPGAPLMPLADNVDLGRDKQDNRDGTDGDPQDGWDWGRGP